MGYGAAGARPGINDFVSLISDLPFQRIRSHPKTFLVIVLIIFENRYHSLPPQVMT
jgi:hypothetical protein